MTFWDALWFIDTVTASIEYLCPGHLQHPTMTMMKTKNTFVLGLNFKRMLRKKKIEFTKIQEKGWHFFTLLETSRAIGRN